MDFEREKYKLMYMVKIPRDGGVGRHGKWMAILVKLFEGQEIETLLT